MTKEQKLNAEQLRETNINKALQEGSQKNMAAAKKNKNDEFYTRLEDIEKEMEHYQKLFKGKTILMNCDDPEWSNFWKYFKDQQQFFGIKKLISTHYEPDGKSSFALIRERKPHPTIEGKFGYPTKKIPLKGNGDFRSEECIEFLKEADVVVTNPPFSLFREYIALLNEYNKKFIVLGNLNAISYKESFKLIKEGEMWLGKENFGHTFISPIDKLNWNPKDPKTYNEKKLGMTIWFTNFGKPSDRPFVELTGQYKGNEGKYPKYDNYDAINVNKVKDIPHDYTEMMGVPITFLHKLNPNQFEILGVAGSNKEHSEKYGFKQIQLYRLKKKDGKMGKSAQTMSFPMLRVPEDTEGNLYLNVTMSESLREREREREQIWTRAMNHTLLIKRIIE